MDSRFFFAFAVLGLGAFLLRPLVGAIAERIRPRPTLPAADNAELVDEVQAMRQELAELAERVDFTERLLAKSTEPARVEQREG